MPDRSSLRRGVLLLVATLLAAAGAAAHGDWPPKHGGQMNDGGETSFELVSRGLALTLHVEDHGTPVATLGAVGTLTVTRGERTWKTALKAPGGNQLSSRLSTALADGDQVLAKVTMPNGSIAAGRFVVSRNPQAARLPAFANPIAARGPGSRTAER